MGLALLFWNNDLSSPGSIPCSDVCVPADQHGGVKGALPRWKGKHTVKLYCDCLLARKSGLDRGRGGGRGLFREVDINGYVALGTLWSGLTRECVR